MLAVSYFPPALSLKFWYIKILKGAHKITVILQILPGLNPGLQPGAFIILLSCSRESRGGAGEGCSTVRHPSSNRYMALLPPQYQQITLLAPPHLLQEQSDVLAEIRRTYMYLSPYNFFLLSSVERSGSSLTWGYQVLQAASLKTYPNSYL